MAKPIAYPAIQNPAYRGEVSELRTILDVLARKIEQSPDFAQEVSDHFDAFDTALSLPTPS